MCSKFRMSLSSFIFLLAHEASKVHFSTDVSPNTEINVVCKSEDEIDVHVGFLQEGHIYEVQFAIPNRLPDGWKHPDLVDSELQIISVDSIGECRVSKCIDQKRVKGGGVDRFE